MNLSDYKPKQDEVVSYYESIAESYDQSRFANSYGRFIDIEERRVLDALIDTEAPGRRLEMACGTGRLTGYATHGLDASSNMMASARARHSGVEFRLASATATGYDNEFFDLVYSFHLLMHLDGATIKDIFHEAHRILKPGGRLIVDIPSRERRELLHHRRSSWHGATHLSSRDMLRMAGDLFALKSTHGIMMLPIHHLPSAMRRRLVSVDYALANGWLKEYSSYLIFELVKK